VLAKMKLLQSILININELTHGTPQTNKTVERLIFKSH